MINLFDKRPPARTQFNHQTFTNPNFQSQPTSTENKTNQSSSQDNFGQLVDLLKTFITQNSEIKKESVKNHLQPRFEIEPRDK